MSENSIHQERYWAEITQLRGQIIYLQKYRVESEASERKWYAVSSGDLTDEEIHDLTFEVKRRKQEAEEEHLSKPLPNKPGLREKAERETERYFQSFYQVEDYHE